MIQPETVFYDFLVTCVSSDPTPMLTPPRLARLLHGSASLFLPQAHFVWSVVCQRRFLLGVGIIV